MNLKKNTFISIRWSTLSTGVTTMIQLAAIYLLGKFFSVSDFGIISILMIILVLAQTFCDAGIGAITVISDLSADVSSSLFWSNILISLIISVLVVISLPVITAVFNTNSFYQYVPFLALLIILNGTGLQHQFILQKKLLFNYIAMAEILSNIFYLISFYILILASLGIWAFLLSQLVKYIIYLLIVYISGIKYFRPAFHFNYGEIKGFVSFGLFNLGEKFITQLTNRIDHIIIGSLLSIESLGYYNFAYNIVLQPLNKINPLINRISFPVLAFFKNNIEQFKFKYELVLKMIAFLNAPIYIFLGIAGPEILQYFWGDKWSGSYTVLRILVLFAYFKSLGNPAGNILLVNKRADLGFYWNIIVFILSAVIIYFSSLFNSIVYVASALALLQIVLVLLSHKYIVQRFIVLPVKRYLRFIFEPLFYAGSSLVIPYLLYYFFDVASLYLILACILIYSGILFFTNKDLLLKFRAVING